MFHHQILPLDTVWSGLRSHQPPLISTIEIPRASWKKLINGWQIGSCNKAAVVWFPPKGTGDMKYNPPLRVHFGQLMKTLIETNDTGLDAAAGTAVYV